jgi:phage terminase small subunit
MKNARKMTARQSAFCSAYITSLNATQAAKEAGYSAKTASQIGERLLRNVEVAAEIERLKKARSERTEITADRVLREFARIGFLDVRKLFNSDGSLKRLDELDDDVAACIASIEVNEMRDGDGFVIGHAKKIRLWDKIASLTKLAQHLGLLDPCLTIKGDAANPLTLLIQQVQGNSLNPVREGARGGDDDNNNT